MTVARRRLSARAWWAAFAAVACVVVGALWWQRERARPEALEAPRSVERAQDAPSEALRGASADVELCATEVEALEPRREPVVATVSPAATEAPERTFAAHDGPPRLIGRALNETGAPISQALLRMTLRGFDWRPSQRGPVTNVRAERDGRFEWILDEALTEPWDAVLRTRLDRRELIAALQVGPLASGVHDVGDVLFGLQPLVVAGRLVDDAGRPVPRVKLEVIGISTYGNDLSGHPQELLTGSADRDGTFALRSQPLPPVPDRGRLEVHARAPGFARAIQAFELGTDLGTWTLARLGGLTGRLVLDPAWPAGLLTVGIEAVAADLDYRLPAAVDTDGTFSFDGLPDGTYDLWLGGPAWIGEAVPLWSSVVISEGGAVALSEPWDVRPLVTTTAVTVLGPDRRPVDSLMALWSKGPAEHWRRSLTSLDADVGGAFHFAHRPEGGSVLLRPPGGLEVEVQCDGTPRTITARQAPRVEIRFLGHERIAAGSRLEAWAVQQEALAVVRTFPIDEHGVGRFEPPVAGSWELHVSLSGWTGSRGASAGEVEVVAGVALQSFELRLPEEWLGTLDTDPMERR